MKLRAIIFAILALALYSSPATSQTKDKITAAFPMVDPTAAVLYAYDLGMFERVGLDVTLQPLSNGGAIAEAVASGQIAFGAGNVLNIESAHSRGLPLTIVAPAAANINSAPSSVLIVAKASHLQKASDLNEKVIATSTLRGITDLLTRAWIDKNGGDATTLKFIEVPFSQVGAVLEQGRADAGLSVEPFITKFKADTRVFANPFAALGDNYLITAYFSSTPWAQAHPTIVARFAAAIREAAGWANKNPSRSAEILAKYAKLDPNVVKRTIRARYATTLTPAQLQPTIDTAARYMYIDRAFPAQELIYHAK